MLLQCRQGARDARMIVSDGFLSVLIQLSDFLSLVYTVHFHRWKLSGPGIGGGLAGLQSFRFRGCPGTFRHHTDVFLLAMDFIQTVVTYCLASLLAYQPARARR